MFITGKQSVAARGLLGWNVTDAGKAAGIHRQTVSNFESSGSGSQATFKALRRVYEENGIHFLELHGISYVGTKET